MHYFKMFVPKNEAAWSTLALLMCTVSLFSQNSYGSGMVFTKEGHIFTNHHVVENSERCFVVKYENGQIVSKLPARIIKQDNSADLAILKVDAWHPEEGAPSSPPPLAQAGDYKAGMEVFVWGFPLPGATSSNVKYSKGDISDLSGLHDNASQIQHTASINPGSSGGPLALKEGRIVGIIVGSVRAAQGVNFAVKIDYLTNLAKISGIEIPRVPVVGDPKEHVKAYTVQILCEGKNVAESKPVPPPKRNFTNGWLTDLDEGIKVAKAEKKAILVDFTGSDWCGWCIRLKKEVFDQKEFAVATNDFVLVELDYPQKKKQSAEVKAKNKVLAEKFGIEGFPTILLLDANGEPFAQTGYEAGGPVKYLAHLAELLKANTAEGRKAFAQTKKDEGLVRAYGSELETILTPFFEKKDLAGGEAALTQFIKAKSMTAATKFSLTINARVSLTQACKPGDLAAVVKVLDAIIAETPADVKELAEAKQFRAQVAAAAAAKEKK